MESHPTLAPENKEVVELRSPAPPAEAAPAPVLETAVQTYPVVHLHVLGSCKGVIRVAADTLSYVPEKGADGFTFKSHEYLCSIVDDRLVVKSGARTYRFKSGIAANKADNLEDLQKIVQALSSHARDSRSKDK